MPNGTDSIYYTYMKSSRALYGQVPVLYNIGLRYAGQKFGISMLYNYMGIKTFVTASQPNLAEYEQPRGRLDAQISHRFLKNRMEVKLNISNLLDAPFRFFINDNTTYEPLPGAPPVIEEWSDGYRYKEGFTDKYEVGYMDNATRQQVGDRQTMKRYVGRTFNLSVSIQL